MPNKKGNQKSGSQGSMGNNPDREFENQGKGMGSGNQGQQAGGYGKDTGQQGIMDDEDMMTAGGREGNFSDQNRDKEDQWSPSSGRSEE